MNIMNIFDVKKGEFIVKSGSLHPMDKTGRIVVPKEIRKALNITEGGSVEISFDNGKIIMEKYIPTDKYKFEIERLKRFIGNDKSFNEGKIKYIQKLLDNLVIEIEK